MNNLVTDIIEIRADGIAIHKHLFAAASYDCKTIYRGYEVVATDSLDKILKTFQSK